MFETVVVAVGLALCKTKNPKTQEPLQLPFSETLFVPARHKMLVSVHPQAKGNSGCCVTLISLMTIFTKQATVHLLVHDGRA